jgi:hypothetical protein
MARLETLVFEVLILGNYVKFFSLPVFNRKSFFALKTQIKYW